MSKPPTIDQAIDEILFSTPIGKGSYVESLIKKKMRAYAYQVIDLCAESAEAYIGVNNVPLVLQGSILNVKALIK